MSLVAELRRRNVFKVGAAYLALAWVVVQAPGEIVPALNLPATLVPTVVWIGIIGFPCVLIFAWVYELTREGLKRESEIDRSQSITHLTGKRLDYIIIALLVLAIGLFVLQYLRPPVTGTAAEAPAAATIGTTPSNASVSPADVAAPLQPAAPIPDEKSSEAELATIADVAGPKGIWIVIDLCYEQLIYDTDPHNLPKVLFDRMRERTILCGSASKAYAMTGWRCGWTIGPAKFIAQCNALQGHATSNVCSITQKAAIAALTGPQEGVTMMFDEYRRRRDAVWSWLTVDPRITCVKPRGAFYLFPYIADVLEATGYPSTNAFAEALLAEAHVAVTAGEGFDAPGFFRLQDPHHLP